MTILIRIDIRQDFKLSMHLSDIRLAYELHMQEWEEFIITLEFMILK